MAVSVRRSFSDERNVPKRFHIKSDDDDLDDLVPFPRSLSPPSASRSSISRHNSPRIQIPRGASAPILLPNGKPLKSSLKSPSLSSGFPAHPHSHLRARSEPSSPVVTPKNVHFPEKDYALATVRVYNRSARPAALSSPANGNGDETETEGEDAPPSRFPFAPTHPAFNYEIDRGNSSSVPSKFTPPANLLLESLNLSPSSPHTSPTKPLLTGSVLVRNLAYEKNVAVRFTLDDWQTVSEVGAHYVDSLPGLPSHVRPPSSEDLSKTPRGWDRFSFTIRLEDYAHSLSTRTLWLAVRYSTSSTYPDRGSIQNGPGGEWWDNNGGSNYRAAFRPIVAPPPHRARPRLEIVSASIPSQRQLPPPATYKEHALGLMVPSVFNKHSVDAPPDRRTVPLRAGKLSLSNYAPPRIRLAPSVSLLCAGPTLTSSPPALVTNPESPQKSNGCATTTTHRASSDEESASPASSTLSTPSVSPTITPRVIIGGQPATPTNPTTTMASRPYDSSEKDDEVPGHGHLADWDWAAHGNGNAKPWAADILRRDVLSLANKTAADGRGSGGGGGGSGRGSDSLYDAFVTQWCFAREPTASPHNTFGDVGIMT